MKKLYGIMFCFMCVILWGFCPVFSMAKDSKVVSIKRISEMNELPGQSRYLSSEESFSNIIIDCKTLIMQKDGDEQDFCQTFHVTKAEATNAMKSEETLQQFFESREKDALYKVRKISADSFEVTRPYQLRRIYISGKKIVEACGESSVYYNPQTEETIFQFPTEVRTKLAYEFLKKKYAQYDVYLDEVLCADAILEGTTTEDESISWGNQDSFMGMETLKNMTFSDKTVTVAVIDTGIDKTNALFKNRVISSKSYNFLNKNKNITDSYNTVGYIYSKAGKKLVKKTGHGTHVSGIIADGTPENVELLILKVMSQNGKTTISVLKNALQYAIKQKCDVINMSLGSRGENDDYLDELIRIAYNEGIPVVTAAGNENANVRLSYPANNEYTIAVSAIGRSLTKASYSNYGNQIDFCAPGTGILSAGYKIDQVYMSGTSMSAPHITAAIAYLKLMKSNISVDGVYNELKKRCVDLGEQGKDVYYGYGMPMMTGLKASDVISTQSVVRSLEKPDIVSLTNTAKGIRVTWKKEENAAKYYLYRKLDSGRYTCIKVLSGKYTTYEDRKVKQKKRYTYCVKAYNSVFGYTKGNAKLKYRLESMKNVKIWRKSDSSIGCSWNKYKGIDGYEICYSHDKDFKDFDVVVVPASKTRVKVNLPDDEKYYVKIRVYKDYNNERMYSVCSKAVYK